MIRLLVIAVLSTLSILPVAYAVAHVFSNAAVEIAVTFGVCYLLFPAVLLRLWPAVREPALEFDTIDEARQRGVLVSTEYLAEFAVAVTEFEDEGAQYFIALTAGTTLFVAGQYLYDVVDDGHFPCSHFRIHWHSEHGFSYGIDCLGEPIEVRQTLPPFTAASIEADETPCDRELIEAELPVVVQAYAERTA